MKAKLMSSELTAEIERITKNDLKERHSFFQLQYFLIGKEPTIQAKLWRCVRELKARRETIDSLKLEIDDVNDDLELINIKSADVTFVADKKQEIRKRKLNRKKTALIRRLENLKERLASVEEEAGFLVKAFNSLEKAEPLRSFDDLHAQKQYWNEKLSQEFNLRLLLGMPMDLELVKTILALNSDAPVKVDALNMIESVQERLENRNKQAEYARLMACTKETTRSEAKMTLDGEKHDDTHI